MYVVVSIVAPDIIHVYGPYDSHHHAMTEMMKMRAADQEMYPDKPIGTLFTCVRKVIADPEDR